jgi:hypothetical protein
MSRTGMQEISESDRAAMDAVMDAVYDAIEGVPASVALSVLTQVLVSGLGDADGMTEEDVLQRIAAFLGVINIMRDGSARRGFDQASLADAVNDIAAVMTCGSRSVMVPALASVLVASVANGRRNAGAEQACAAEIRVALDRLEGQLVS